VSAAGAGGRSTQVVGRSGPEPGARSAQWANCWAGRLALVGLCVAGAVVRFSTLGEQSFWLDEAVTGRLMRLGFGAMLRAIPRSESTPPLYYVLAWLWTRVFGVSEVGLRSLSAVLGTLTIPLLYAAGARFFDRRAGLVAAGLGTFAPLLIWYSQEARSYALLVALCAAGLWAFAGALETGRSGRRALGFWALLSALALATHYFAVFLVGPELCWLAWRLGRPALPAFAGVTVSGLALAPLAIHQRANGGAGFIARTALGTRVAQAVKQLALGYDAPGDAVVVGIGCLLGVAVVWLAWRALAGRPRVVAAGLAGLGGASVLAPVIVGLAGADYVITRNLIVGWVPVAIAVAAVLGSAGRAGVVVLAGICMVGLGVTVGVDLNARYQRDDWRGVAEAVPARTVSAVVVTPSSGRLALEYYLPGARPLGAAGARVASVEVIALGARGVGDAVQAPALPGHLLTLAGFLDPTASRHATFTVIRYRAADGTAVVTRQTLIPLAPSPSGTTQLVTDGG
jgi:mannosyltransferase